MKQFDGFLENVDKKVNRYITPLWLSVQKYLPLFTIAFVVTLIGVTVTKLKATRPDFVTAIITNDVKKISGALNAINNDCQIIGCAAKETPINFLDVVAFAGSEINGLTLAAPAKWRGPYAHENPTVQHKLYQLVKAPDGLFIVPGLGVELPNGFVVGHDFIVDGSSAIGPLLKKGGFLRHNNSYLAAKVSFSGKKLLNYSSHNVVQQVKTLSESSPKNNKNAAKKSLLQGIKPEVARSIS